jgi:hypothetical protein
MVPTAQREAVDLVVHLLRQGAGHGRGWNNRRLHGTPGMITPSEVEQAYDAAVIPREQLSMRAAPNLGHSKVA